MEVLNSVTEQVVFYGRIILDVLGALVVLGGVAWAIFARRFTAAEQEIEHDSNSWRF